MKIKCCASAYELFQDVQKSLENGFEMPAIYEWNDFFDLCLIKGKSNDVEREVNSTFVKVSALFDNLILLFLRLSQSYVISTII